ncbi:hypothetical protein KY347_05045 [Candidatus Woesearchaeota archaeon]|nr:hypothetical protein [Candidatus Woesearchaeota archaeon]
MEEGLESKVEQGKTVFILAHNKDQEFLLDRLIKGLGYEPVCAPNIQKAEATYSEKGDVFVSYLIDVNAPRDSEQGSHGEGIKFASFLVETVDKRKVTLMATVVPNEDAVPYQGFSPDDVIVIEEVLRPDVMLNLLKPYQNLPAKP